MWLIRNSHDVINIHNYSFWLKLPRATLYPLHIIERMKRVPVVLTLHGSKELYQAQKTWDAITGDMRRSDFTVFVDYFMMKYGSELNLKSYGYVPNPIDPTLFHPMEEDIELRESLNLQDKFVILTVSRLSPERNVEFVLQIAKAMEGERDVVFLIVGGGEHEGYLRSLSHKLGCANVMFTGEIAHSALPRYLSIAKAFLNPLGLPGIGRNVLEAMACEKPVLRRSIEDDPLLVNKTNFIGYKRMDDLVESILLLKSDERLTAKLGEEARKFVMTNCSIDAVWKKYEDIYEKLMR